MAPIRGQDLAAVVLTGGRGTRLGGVDKAGLVLGGKSLLDRAVELAATVADPVVVVGHPAPVHRPVRWTREEPPGGGPAAGLLAGARTLDAAWLLALAVDMPLLTSASVLEIYEAAVTAGADGAVLVDEDGRRQPLCGVYRRAALLATAPEDADGLPVRWLLEGMSLAEVPARGGESGDIDTPEQLERIRAILDR